MRLQRLPRAGGPRRAEDPANQGGLLPLAEPGFGQAAGAGGAQAGPADEGQLRACLS